MDCSTWVRVRVRIRVRVRVRARVRARARVRDLELLGAYVLGLEGERLLHGDQCHHLQG